MGVEITKHIIRVECDGVTEKPELPTDYDARDTVEYKRCMAEDSSELLAVFDRIIELAEQRGDIPCEPRPRPNIKVWIK